MILVNVPGGASQNNTAAVRKALAVFPGVKLQTAAELKESELAGIASMLNILYVCSASLSSSASSASFNTLVLSLFGRTRERGMLKAIGMTPRQVRRVIRQETSSPACSAPHWDSRSARRWQRSRRSHSPTKGSRSPTLVTFVVLAIAAGMIAAILPARRASRLNALAALQYE